MKSKTPHRIVEAELLAALEQVLDARVKSVRRQLCAYSSSCTIENLEVTLVQGKKLRLVLKDLSATSTLATAQQIRPHFLYHPAREIKIYQKILNPARLGTAHCLGVVVSPRSKRHWLFLEQVDGPLLWQVGDLNHWDEAARWLATLHHKFAGRKPVAAGSLLRYDEKFFGLWISRATNFTRPRRAADLRKFERLAKKYARVVEQLTALPKTFIHGEFYPSNVLVREGNPSARICAIDWEMSGVGPGALDLAALTAGKWSAAQKRRFIHAYLEALPANSPLRATDLMAAVELCQLHQSVQMLGWAEDWSPPKLHTQNWLRTALRLAEKLDL